MLLAAILTSRRKLRARCLTHRIGDALRDPSDLLPLRELPVLLHQSEAASSVVEVGQVELNDTGELGVGGRDVVEDLVEGSAGELSDSDAAVGRDKSACATDVKPTADRDGIPSRAGTVEAAV